MRKLKARIQHWIDRVFRLEEINGGDICPTYLFRWTMLATPLFKVYLHHFVASDWSLDLHDHPKRFVSIGVWGGYTEQTPPPEGAEWCEYRRYQAPWIRSFPASHMHRLILAEGHTCWTIAIVSKAVRQWGFWPDGKWVQWKEYVGSERAKRMKSCPD
jgi:hypothetical protein